jgi:hypothetical protein
VKQGNALFDKFGCLIHVFVPFDSFLAIEKTVIRAVCSRFHPELRSETLEKP